MRGQSPGAETVRSLLHRQSSLQLEGFWNEIHDLNMKSDEPCFVHNVALPETYFQLVDASISLINQGCISRILLLPSALLGSVMWAMWKSAKKFLLLCFSTCCGKNWHLRLCLHYLYLFDRLNLYCTSELLKTCL